MRILVFGSTGQVARELGRAHWAEGTVLTRLDRQAADLARPDRLPGIVRDNHPDAVIVAAAYTDVEGAESDEATATTVNATAPGIIAREAARLSIPVLYFSSDYVFDGEKGAPYDEDDPPRPLSAYGRSKRAGEDEVRSASARNLILRTSWVYSAHGRNFMRTMLRLASRQDTVGVVADQRGCPTSAGDLADAVARIMPSLIAGDISGTYHLAGATAATWHGFAEAIFAALEARGYRRPRNNPIRTDDHPTVAVRPMNSVLSSERIAQDFGIRLAGFETALPAVLDEALRESVAAGSA